MIERKVPFCRVAVAMEHCVVPFEPVVRGRNQKDWRTSEWLCTTEEEGKNPKVGTVLLVNDG